MQVATSGQTELADLALLCLDLSRELSAWESDQIARPQSRRLIVWTKSDAACHSLHDPSNGIKTSSRTGEGVAKLKEAICEMLVSPHGESGAIAATADRCRESLRRAGDALCRAASSAALGSGEELVAAEARVALDELGQVTGAVYTDDLLDRVFSRFCIGK
jgi:tRNA modification GTPase